MYQRDKKTTALNEIRDLRKAEEVRGFTGALNEIEERIMDVFERK